MLIPALTSPFTEDLTLTAESESWSGEMGNIQCTYDGNLTVPETPTAVPQEDPDSWDNATWILTCTFIIFTMQSGKSIQSI